MSKRYLIAVCAVLLCFGMAVGNLPAQAEEANSTTKQLAGPPSDILNGMLNLPDASQIGIRSHSSMIPVAFQPAADGSWVWTSDLPVESAETMAMLVFAPQNHAWDVRVAPAGASEVSLKGAATTDGVSYEASMFGIGENQYPAEVYTFARPTPGTWNIRIAAAASADGQRPDGYLLVSSEASPYRIFSHLSSYDLLVGNQVGLVSYVYENSTATEKGAPSPLDTVKVDAALHLTYPNNQKVTLTMVDDGQHADGAANDGVFGALVDATLAGEYQAQVVVRGVSADGQAFLRTSEHIFPVIEPSFSLVDGTVTADVVDGVRLQVDLNATQHSKAAPSVVAFAEVWGTASDGSPIPVAWIGGITAPVATKNGTSLGLSLDGRWVALARAAAPFELRNVRIQDLETHIPLARLERVSMKVDALPQAAFNKVDTITDEMLMGARPADLAEAKNTPNYIGGRKLMLVHGYCSGTMWPTSHFSNYAVFQDLRQSRTTDYFAQLIRNYGNEFDSFGVVAHSHGGLASLHLYTYYWSGLDYSSGSRLIQTVGSPYQGTALAGNLAALGSIFGVGCGTNWDLTYDGAALWLSGIPTWARSRVYYHTTSFTDNWWSYDYCHIASDVVLGDPDDGTIEKWSGQLSGGNNMGHKTGWCHTTGMRDPSQYNDASRNSTMNTYANR